MSLKNIIAEIDSDVLDITKTSFEHLDTGVVPRSDDADLTYERTQAKKGKKIKTCVLYVDIRNSVALTEKHHTQTMGRIYTAFTKAVLKVARYHNGHTRNIIGDRIMIVFPSKNCFTNAVDCAISIHHISKFVINTHFRGVDFKCGIGIDFGELNVIKVGIQRNGTERGENKGLVWVGYPANIASRLTDMANKEVEDVYFTITRKFNRTSIFERYPRLSHIFGTESPILKQGDFQNFFLRTEDISAKDFMDALINFKDGDLNTSGVKIVGFEKKTRTIKYPGILMTDKVFNGFKSANPNRNSILNNYWVEQNYDIKNVKNKIYGGGVIWNFK